MGALVGRIGGSSKPCGEARVFQLYSRVKQRREAGAVVGRAKRLVSFFNNESSYVELWRIGSAIQQEMRKRQSAVRLLLGSGGNQGRIRNLDLTIGRTSGSFKLGSDKLHAGTKGTLKALERGVV